MNNKLIRPYNLAFHVAILALAGMLFNRCGPTTGISSSSSGSYTEDLTIFRPPVIMDEPNEVLSNDDSVMNIDFEIQGDITYKIDSLLDSISVNNQNKKYIQGYTIQVYTGNNRTLANNIIAEVYNILYGSRPTLTYDLPNYKVKVGKYYHRIEAQKDFYAVKRKYKNAILVPQQFKID